METETSTRRIAGLTISCDHCPATATTRSEATNAHGCGFDVRWACDEHARILPSNAAVAVGRFQPEGASGYRSSHSPSAPLRQFRVEAERDWLAAYLELPARNVAGDPLIGCQDCGGLVFDSHHDGLCGACRPVDLCCAV